MKVTVKGVVKYVLMLALAGVLLYFAFRNISWSDFVTGLKSCNYWWILATILLGLVSTILRGFRWRLMMLPLNKNITRRESYDAYAICYLANLALPRSGEVVRCGLIANTGKASFEGALGSVVLERTWDMICLAVICVAMVFFTRFGDFLVEKMFNPVVEALPFNAIWLVVVLIAICLGIYFILKANKEKVSRSKFGAKMIKLWHGLVGGVKAGFKMDHKWAFHIYTILIWLSYWATSLLMVVGSLGWVVPVQGGFGAYHFIVSMTLVPIYGVTQSTGLIFATISHESQVVQMIICGIISLISVAVYKKKLKNTVQPVTPQRSDSHEKTEKAE